MCCNKVAQVARNFARNLGSMEASDEKLDLPEAPIGDNLPINALETNLSRPVILPKYYLMGRIFAARAFFRRVAQVARQTWACKRYQE
jgi:hypothetical protein